MIIKKKQPVKERYEAKREQFKQCKKEKYVENQPSDIMCVIILQGFREILSCSWYINNGDTMEIQRIKQNIKKRANYKTTYSQQAANHQNSTANSPTVSPPTHRRLITDPVTGLQTTHRLPTADHQPTDKSYTDLPTTNSGTTDRPSNDPPTIDLPTTD